MRVISRRAKETYDSRSVSRLSAFNVITNEVSSVSRFSGLTPQG